MKIDILQQTVCANYSLATDSYIYGYTSYNNLTEFAKLVLGIAPLIDFSYFCAQFSLYFFCNFGFVPCDLTSGAPRAICTESCNYAAINCSSVYNQVVAFVKAFGYTVKEDCENTLNFIQDFGFTCSSSSLQNGCIDLLGM